LSNSLTGKTLFISGGSRGIGLAIALRAARDGANIAIAAKTAEAHPSLPGTIYTAAQAIEAAGGKALPLLCDIRDEDQVEQAVALTVQLFGGIDACINNASAIKLTGIIDTPVKRFDLMNGVNGRGTFLVTQKCIPHLLKSDNPHVMAISPPLLMEERWFAPHVAYSMVILGVAGEYRGRIGVNALWPRTAIATAAMAEFEPASGGKPLRSPQIMADAAHLILTADARSTTGNFFIDDELMAAHGVTDLSGYAPDGVADIDILPDFFVPSLRQLQGLSDPDNPYRQH
jgi:citronellol/citronellal dehydrogenase